MKKRKSKTQPEKRRPKNQADGQRTYRGNGKAIVTHSVAALPILHRFLERMQLRQFLERHLPPDDLRTKVDAPRVVLLLLKNLLVSREPIYGVAEWASNFAPELFDLRASQLGHLNDDRVGRCLDTVFRALDSNLIMDVVTHVVREFDIRLDELHNDSTTVTFSGDYPQAGIEQTIAGRLAPAITWGHNKDHRPDLKQLLYILTVSDDGGVPLYFQTVSGNVVDDQTHQATWKILAELVQRPDFVYVADCKLATSDNLNAIARQGGRFITVLPATRKEDSQFRQRLLDKPESIGWDEIYRLTNDEGKLRDIFEVCTDDHLSKEGYRLLWFRSQGKRETDAAIRAGRLERAMRELSDLRDRLQSTRSRFRTHAKVTQAVDAILDAHDARAFLHVEIELVELESFRQAHPGRPTEKTQYTRDVQLRFQLNWKLDLQQIERAAAGDGVFPLTTNLLDWQAVEVLKAYKRQPMIEKRFSQLKTDFCVAPVFLKSVSRIVGLLTVYFFALIVQTLLERELRNRLKTQRTPSLPLYPEGRGCTRPTTRQVLDVFEPIARHTLRTIGKDHSEVFTTELAPIHRMILKLLRIPQAKYRS